MCEFFMAAIKADAAAFPIIGKTTASLLGVKLCADYSVTTEIGVSVRSM